jgi:uncharacterized Zn finger protein
MSRYDYYGYYKPTKPIETDEGIKATSKKGKFAKNWWANRWIAAMEKLTDAGRLRRGRTYARKGQVLSIDEVEGGIKAKVQGSRPKPYQITFDIAPLNDKQWDQVIDALADQAIFTAQLLAGEMPQEIESVFETAKVSLFPDKSLDLITDCSCPDYSNPCKHVAAVHYILAERFDEDPFMLFRLRGRSQEQIMATLRAKHTADLDADEVDAVEDEPAVPLSELVDQFWSAPQPLTEFKTNIKPPVTELPVLKRLGQPGFLSEDVLSLLGPAYRQISEQAIAAAFTETTTETNDDPADPDE